MKMPQLIQIAGLSLILPQLAGVTPGFAAETQLGGGTYQVPVSDAELIELARFPIQFDVELDHRGGLEKLRYRLPRDLTGARLRKITLQPSAEEPGVLIGENAKAVCGAVVNVETGVADPLDLQCSVTYRNLRIDPLKVRQHLDRTVLDPETLRKKLEIAVQFEREPIGIIRYRLDEK